MESEKVKEIKKAIQETIDGKLSTEYLTVCEISCCPRLDVDRFLADILTLINELESKNEGLRKENDQFFRVDFLRLTNTIAELEKENKEQLKRFAERLKEEIEDMEQFYRSCIDTEYSGLTKKQLDETLKEFVGVEE